MASTPKVEVSEELAAVHGETIAQRIRAAHQSRQAQADVDHAKAMAERDMVGPGIYEDTVRRFTHGVDPAWLIRAKQLYVELGSCIYVLSRQASIDLPVDAIAEATKRVKAFLSAMPNQTSSDRFGIMMLLVVVDCVARRGPYFVELIDAGQPPRELVCFAVSTMDLDLAERLAEHVDAVELLVERWMDTTPRQPTKWAVAASLWLATTGTALKPNTIRQEWAKVRSSRATRDDA